MWPQRIHWGVLSSAPYAPIRWGHSPTHLQWLRGLTTPRAATFSAHEAQITTFPTTITAWYRHPVGRGSSESGPPPPPPPLPPLLLPLLPIFVGWAGWKQNISFCRASCRSAGRRERFSSKGRTARAKGARIQVRAKSNGFISANSFGDSLYSLLLRIRLRGARLSPIEAPRVP